MAVAFDAKGTTFTGGATTSFTNTSLTIGSISNRVLIAFVQFGAAITSPVGKWDSTGTFQPVTLIGSKAASDNLSFAYLFGLINPHTGNKTFSLSWTGSSDYAGQLVSFSGADQDAFATTFKNLATDASSPGNTNYPLAGMVITTISGDMAVLSVATNNGTVVIGAGPPAGLGTQIEAINTNVGGEGRYLAAAGSTTTIAGASATTGPNTFCGVGCAISAVGNIPASKIMSVRLRQYLRR